VAVVEPEVGSVEWEGQVVEPLAQAEVMAKARVAGQEQRLQVVLEGLQTALKLPQGYQEPLELVELEVEQILLLPPSLVVEVAEEATTAEVEAELTPIALALTVVVAVVDLASSMQLNSQHLST
jgi:hypothetical protein